MYTFYCRLNVHVLASDREVIRRTRAKMDKNLRRMRSWAKLRKMTYRNVLTQHHKAQELYRAYRF